MDVNILTYDQQMEGFRFLGVEGNRTALRKSTKADMELTNQIHIQPLASCIGGRKVFVPS